VTPDSPTHPHTHLTLIPSPYSLISSPYPPTIPLSIPFTPSLLSPLFSPTLQPHTPNYLSIYPSTFQPNPTFRLTHLSPSHPLSTSPHHIPMFSYFPSLLVIPGSHS